MIHTEQTVKYIISQIKNYNVLIDGENVFENIREIATGPGDDSTTAFLLDYGYFKNYYKMIAIDLSKQ